MQRCDSDQQVDCHIDSLIVLRKPSRGTISQGHWLAFMIASNSLLVRAQISLNQNPCTTPSLSTRYRARLQANQSFIHRQTEKMCTQEIVWCSCGHGEFLPIVKCPQAEAVGVCFTVVHGDHRVVLPMDCSYCISGQSGRAALSTNARPQGELAALIERNNANRATSDGLEDGAVANTDSGVTLGVEDVASADWSSGFDLDPELWQYV